MSVKNESGLQAGDFVMPNRIVLITGAVETLTYFSKELGKTFEEKGYKVFYYDLKEKEVCFSRLKRFLKPGETVLVTFNHVGLCEEDLLYHPQYGYIWEQFQIPVYSIVVDHPLYYHNHLSNPVKGYHYIGIDKYHIQYVEKYYPNVQVCGFLPLAGMEIQKNGKGEKERDIPVLFTGNYQSPEKFKPYIERIDEEYSRFYYRIINEVLRRPEETLEEAAKRFCIQEMGEISDKDFADVMAHMNFIDLYVRNTRRGEVVRTLLDAGISVELVGDGWEKLACKRREMMKIHAQTDTGTCLAFMQRAQISINVMPEFKNGAHDRIFSSILNGAVSVSDDSIYLREILSEGEGICYYSRSRLAELPVLVEELLEHPEKRQEIAARGYEKVRTAHTWKNRAEQLIKWIESA